MSIAMKNYDDLQRFKDKTRTGAIEFKDMSAQNQQLNTSSWAIIKQLSGDQEDSVLAQAGSVSVAIPQAVKPGEFDAAFAKPAAASAAEPVAAQRSILGSLASSVLAEKTAELPPAEAKSAAVSLLDQLAPAVPAFSPEPAPLPELAAAPAPAKQNAEHVGFKQLFAAKGSAAAGHPAKDLPLQPLLEMIASCR
jgi:hypothetical protein